MKNIILLISLFVIKPAFAFWFNFDTVSLDSPCNVLRLSDDGSVMAIKNPSLSVWHLGEDSQWTEAVLPGTPQQHDTPVVAITGDGDFVATAHNDLLVLYYFDNGEWRESFINSNEKCHQANISAIAFSQDKQRLFTAAQKTIKFWQKVGNSYSYQSEIPELSGQARDIISLSVDAVGRIVATLDNENHVVVWKEQGTQWVSMKLGKEDIYSMDLAASGNYLVVGSNCELLIFRQSDDDWVPEREICQVSEPIIFVQITQSENALLCQVQPHEYNVEAIDRYGIVNGDWRLVNNFFNLNSSDLKDEDHIVCMSGQGNIIGITDSYKVIMYRWRDHLPKNAQSTVLGKRLANEFKLPPEKK